VLDEESLTSREKPGEEIEVDKTTDNHDQNKSKDNQSIKYLLLKSYART
jgi:hypothetical protein